MLNTTETKKGEFMYVCMLNPPYMPYFVRSARWQEVGKGGTLYYPIWLAYATGIVEQQHPTVLIDAPAKGWDSKTTASYIARKSFDLIIIETSFPSLKNDLTVADFLKKHTGAKVVIVGPPASIFDQRILKSSSVDIVARYEYDFTISDVANVLNSRGDLKSINGISYKCNSKIIRNPDRQWIASEELDTLPFVSSVYKRHLNIKDYFLSSSMYPEVQIFTGRGCPFQCTFCLWPQTFMGRAYRTRSVKNVVDELDYIAEELPEVNEVIIEDDTFTADIKRVREICKEIMNRNLDVTWNCQVRALLDSETLKLMAKAGCRLVIVGFESADDTLLKNIKKGSSVSDARKFAENAHKAGLLVHADFMIGLPGESRTTIEKTRKLIKEIKPSVLQVSIATPFPGTEFYEWAEMNGYLVTNDPNNYLDKFGRQKSVISYPWLSAEEISRAVDEILREYYFSISYIPTLLRQVSRRHGLYELKRLLHSMKVYLSRTLTCRAS